MPDGRRQEAEQSIVVGQSIELSWKALNDSTNDLWLMSMDEGDDVFTQPIAGMSLSYQKPLGCLFELTTYLIRMLT